MAKTIRLAAVFEASCEDCQERELTESVSDSGPGPEPQQRQVSYYFFWLLYSLTLVIFRWDAYIRIEMKKNKKINKFILTL